MRVVITAFVTGLAMAFFGPILRMAFGILSAMIVGLFWPNTYAAIAEHFNWPFAIWQTGAMLGFIGGYLATSTTVTGGKD